MTWWDAVWKVTHMTIGVLFGCFGTNRWVSIPGSPGGLIIYQGNPSICPKRTPMHMTDGKDQGEPTEE